MPGVQAPHQHQTHGWMMPTPGDQGGGTLGLTGGVDPSQWGPAQAQIIQQYILQQQLAAAQRGVLTTTNPASMMPAPRMPTTTPIMSGDQQAAGEAMEEEEDEESLENPRTPSPSVQIPPGC